MTNHNVRHAAQMLHDTVHNGHLLKLLWHNIYQQWQVNQQADVQLKVYFRTAKQYILWDQGHGSHT